MPFPVYRARRMRQTAALRRMVRETALHTDDVIMPLFVRPGKGVKKEIASMPGNYQMSVDCLVPEVQEIEALGVPAVILFGIPERKDALGTEGYADHGIVQQALRALKDAHVSLTLITDVCMCEYTDHGHCGALAQAALTGELDVDNDRTLELLSNMALSHVAAGADMVAPSDMMDGRVGAIRGALDEHGHTHIPIMAYSAKYASGFYGPFRDAAESPPQFGDRSTYQMDPPNAEEALREVELDIQEGADIVMVKPALAYLDIIWRVKRKFGRPVAAYNVSGEFAMVKAAAANGWLDEKRIALEMLTSIKRAGADMILTYWAKDVARWVREG